LIEIKNLSKTFKTLDLTVNALNDINLTINDGDIFGIIGMSGAGKSTLVRSINMLEKPTQGQILIDGVDVTKLNNKQLRTIRKQTSMIFQSFNLLLQRNVLNNVIFPLELEGYPKAKAKEKALELLELVGLKDKALSYPVQLSGGQQQRVAIARALATNPKVLLCDEATSALDPNTTISILDLIKDINKKLNITVIIITHQMNVVERICNKVAILENGVIAETGDVEAIFSHPTTEVGRKLVFPDTSDNTNDIVSEHKYVIRVVFNGALAANKPLISQLAIECGINANIAYASTKAIGEKAYGSMLLCFDGKTEKDNAIQFLTKTTDIIVEDLTKEL